ncbi:Smr/MutS family protein [Celeribacter sp.]|uniref:Smr/MutS family protein n=1 Tax=Celeribacter sp. TaxID=1890673 RepID=UPI003A9487D2
MTRRKKGRISKEDAALWDAVRKTATPINVSRLKSSAIDESALPRKVPPTPEPKPREYRTPEFEIGAKRAHTPMGHNLSQNVSDRLAAAPLQMDRKKHGKMTKGKLTPEARIDLHGKTLAAAHPALIQFIMRSSDAGMRLVLVITGKGKHRDEPGPIPVRKGVLKNQVPHWLYMPPLHDVVLQVREAHLKHGGSGAYYVYLRRRR